MYKQNWWLKLDIAAIYERVKSEEKEEKNDDDSSSRRRTRRQKVCNFARIDASTQISFMASNNPYMKLVYPKGAQKHIKVTQWDAETMGIGGLDSQFTTIFRRAFASRLYPPDIVNKLGIKHVKGMLLFGVKYNHYDVIILYYI